MYASGKLLRETYGDTTLDFFCSTSGQPYALKHNGTAYYYITNLQGDVMSIVDGTGAVVAEYEYDPYGNILSTTGTLADTLGQINPLRYRGYVYDQEIGLYYLQSRYYDPGMGRFLNADAFASTGQGVMGHNMFSYAMNNSVNRVDASGTCSTFLWIKLDCTNVTCPDSVCYNPDAPRVAIIYDNRSSGYLFGRVGGDDGFRHQGQQLAARLSATCNVETYTYTTMDEFIECWNELSGPYEVICIIGHGQPGKFNAVGGTLSADGEKYNYSMLNPANVDAICLLVCNGATPGSGQYSISTAKSFANLNNADVLAMTDGKMNFTWYGCYPYANPDYPGTWIGVYPD